ncbi:MAG TPA: DNA-binding protein [Anaerolineae bacterium]|nr:DNA-binding protein [Anaerolineae bacterium]HPL30887.1 DNA-binding protein [Anaerolineae bacterium]
MRYAQLGDYLVLRLNAGEEVLAELRRFLFDNDVLGGSFLAWGAFSRVRLQYNRLVEGTYRPEMLEIDRPVEVASLLGSIANLNDEPAIHAHLVAGDDESHTYSGHLAAGIVGPTLEVIVNPLPRALHRTWNARLGVAVLDPEEVPEEAERLAAWP